MTAVTEEGQMIREMAERLLRDIAPDADPKAHWARIEEAGLPLMLVAQAQGGYGLDVHDGAAVIALTGHFATPLPLAETIVANRLLSDAGLAPADGRATFGGGTGLVLRADGTGWVAEGRLVRMPWARDAELVAIGKAEDGFRLVRLPRPDPADLEPGADLAEQPSDSVRVKTALAPERVGAVPVGADLLDRAGAAMRCIQMAGAMQAVLDMTVAHVKDRTQFGRALGAFQAVQHQVAVLASEAAAATVAGDLAVDGWSEGYAVHAIAAAKIRAGEAAGSAARIAHQLHGAIGFTHEYRLHHFVRRLWAWREAFGGESAWALRLGRALSAGGGDRLWPALTAI